MKPFFGAELQSLDRVHERCAAIAPLCAQRVALDGLCGRTLAGELRAPCDLPGFARSTMDGYAVVAADTFGCSEGAPGYLELVAEVAMGQAPLELTLRRGQCAQIATGGMLPAGADAVVMVEHTRVVAADGSDCGPRANGRSRSPSAPGSRVGPARGTIEVSKPVAPGGHVVGPRDDAEAGQVLLAAGHLLRPQDVGLLAALGQLEATVVRRPAVGIISTGDEVVPVEQTPAPGEVRDVNAYTLAALAKQAGATSRAFGLVRDDRQALRAAVSRSLEQCELTLLSGGSSVGSRDLTAEVFSSFPGAELLVHGVTVAPGKPFIWVRVGDRNSQLLGLPGHVASCIVAFHLFVEPMIERLLGRPARSFSRFGRREVTLTRGLPAASGRETYVRVRVFRDEAGGWVAEPQFGKSALLRTMVQSDGLVRVPLGHEGFAAGARVTALTFPA